MVVNEEEIISALRQCTKRREASVLNDVLTKDESEDFGGYDGRYVQQRVSSSFEFDYILCAFFNLLLHIKDAI